jgi:rod shape-determining protein MreD
LKYLIITLYLLGSLVLQSTLLEEFKVAGVKPDLLLVFVVFWALFHGKREGAKMGFIFGLAEDLFMSKFIGLNILCKMAVGYMVGAMENKFFTAFSCSCLLSK